MKWQKITLFISALLLAGNVNSQQIFKDDQQRQAVFRIILSPELRQVYELIADPLAMEKWEQKYWKVSDPTPNNEVNEFYDEFIDRFKFAKKHYSNIISPLYLDDRGKYYLKYGEPDEKVISVGIGNKAYDDNETWAYYDYNLFIDFVEEIGFGFREANSLLQAVKIGFGLASKIRAAAELYVERESLHPKYISFQKIADQVGGLETADWLRAEADLYQITGSLNKEKSLALDNAPPTKYSFSHEKERLDAQLTSAVFRGEHGNSRAELYYSLPLRQLNFEPDTQIPLASLVEKQLTIYNQDFDKVLHKEEGLKIGARNQQEIEKRIYINQHTEQLNPGLYNIALQLDNRSGKKMAILRAQLNVKDFSRDSLMISDIQLASQIREGVTSSRNVKPNGILVVPYLGNIINKARPISVYFEVYHLTVDEPGQTRFKVSYEVRSISGE